jgi:ubiquinone/menaquinone biosynthesis C-methylase UbiE
MKTTPKGTAGTVERTHSRDPYARIADLDESVVAMLAERLETRARQDDQQRLWREVLSRATYADGSRVLEVGCGTGIVTEKIADRPGVTSVVGVDPSPYFIDRARRRAPSLRFDVADGRALPYADGSFDGVVMATALCHIPGPEQALAEAHRVLKPDGSLLIYDGDYATTTVAISPRDPLQTCVDTSLAQLVHDPWLIRRLRPLVQAAEFQPGRLHSHGYVETVSPTYLFTIVDFGADALAAQGEISPATAEAFKDEARERARSGRFFGHIAYASLLATQRQ